VSATRLLVGFHAVLARLRHDARSIDVIYVNAQRHDRRMAELVERAEHAGARVVATDPQRLDQMAAGASHQGVVAQAAPLSSVDFDSILGNVGTETLLLVLDGVTDPRNLGACMRVADAAGAAAVIVPRDRSAAASPEAAKAAAGAMESLPLIAVTNLARAMGEMREAGIWIAGAAGEAEATIFDIDLVGPRAWALGAEGTGLRRLTREKCDWLANIPMAGSVESLNVSVAAGICLFETVRQRRAAAR
jgi:23S rRNA (guanosine2251-2'-O)-methyltransferase